MFIDVTNITRLCDVTTICLYLNPILHIYKLNNQKGTLTSENKICKLRHQGTTKLIKIIKYKYIYCIILVLFFQLHLLLPKNSTIGNVDIHFVVAAAFFIFKKKDK